MVNKLVKDNYLTPNLDILPAYQRIIWKKLSQVPSFFTLYGGTAIALQLGHRDSIDFDFFGSENFDVDRLLSTTPFLKKAEVIEKSESGITCLVGKKEPVQLSFFSVPNIPHIIKPLKVLENNLNVASLLDLAGMKISVIQKRIEPKDYIDIDALITSGITLSTALTCGKIIYKDKFNPVISLKALSFFDEKKLKILPNDLKYRLNKAISGVNIDKLPHPSKVIKDFKGVNLKILRDEDGR